MKWLRIQNQKKKLKNQKKKKLNQKKRLFKNKVKEEVKPKVDQLHSGDMPSGREAKPIKKKKIIIKRRRRRRSFIK